MEQQSRWTLSSLSKPVGIPLAVLGSIGAAFGIYKYTTSQQSEEVKKETPELVRPIERKDKSEWDTSYGQEIARYLILKERQTDPQNARRERDLKAAFRFACRDGESHFVEVLLHLGVKEEERDSDVYGWKALHLATLSGHNTIVEYLLSQYEPSRREEMVKSYNLLNGWTPLHIATSKDNTQLVQLFIKNGADVNATDKAGHTPLIIAACNGSLSLCKLLLEHKADVSPKTSQSRDSALYLAARNGHTDIVKLLIENKADLQDTTVSGAAPLSAACAHNSLDTVKALVESGAKVNHQQLDGSSALHIAAAKGNDEIVVYLLQHNADTTLTDRFGKTPLHDACLWGHVKVVEKLLAHGAPLDIPDNDGLGPLHVTCRATGDIQNHVQIAELLIQSGAYVNAVQPKTCSPLIIATCKGDKAAPLVELLLKHGADPTHEGSIGWTPLHYAYSEMTQSETITKIIESELKNKHPEFLKTFSKDKPRTPNNRSRIFSRLNDQERLEVLNGTPSLESIANRIKSGRSKNVIVLTGAGISVSAGIPDFRSPKTGMYSSATLKKYDLPSPSAAFDPVYLRMNPKPFFEICRDIFYPIIQGKYKPTVSHYFIRMLHDKGLLLRNYTQNIDTLERVAGIPGEMLVESHGSFAKCFCMDCGKPGSMKEFWEAVAESDVPKCKSCGKGTVRPDVVFFGEGLPAEFSDRRMKDFEKCDLLIVMGTSLVVYPFASLVGDVSDATPRLLINKEPVGAFRNHEDEGNYRDVAFLGECDDGVLKLAQLLGWDEELKQLATQNN